MSKQLIEKTLTETDEKLEPKLDLINIKKIIEKEVIERPDFIELLSLEHKLYKVMDKLLISHPYHKDCYHAINEHFDLLKDIYEALTASTLLKGKNHSLFKKEIGEDKAHLIKQLDFFVNHALFFRKGDSKSSYHFFLGLIQKIFSNPTGRHLIIQLNQLAQQKKYRIEVGLGDFFGVEFKEQKKTDCQLVLSFALKNFSLGNFFFGLTQEVIFHPPFISLAHELIHILRFFQKRTITKIPEAYNRPLIKNFYSNSDTDIAEEIATILTDDNINENSIRKDHGLNFRLSHKMIAAPFDGPNPIENALTILTQVRTHLSKHLTPSEFKAVYEGREPPTETSSLSSLPHLWQKSDSRTDLSAPLLLDTNVATPTSCCHCLIL